jgi:uncharacterized membrane protein
MRWKLLLSVSVVAGVVGFGLWAAVALVVFGSGKGLAQHDWLLLASAFIPIGLAIYAAMFVYRHTARRRKTQAVLAAIFSLLLGSVTYLLTARFFPERLSIPPPSELRNSR